MPRLSWWQWLVPAAIAGLGAWLRSVGAPWAVVVLICGLLFVPWAYVNLKRMLDARARRAGQRDSMFENWTLLAVSLLFCLGAAAMIPRNPHMGVVILLFFGGCAAMAAWTIRNKLRKRGFRGRSVSVEPGRRIPMNTPFLMALAGGCLVIGGGMASVAPPLVAALGAFMALVGLVMLGLRAAGFFRRWIRFDPDGLVFGEPRLEFEIPWDSLIRIQEVIIHDSPLVLLYVDNLGSIKVRPASAAANLRRRIQRMGLAISPSSYGVDVMPLLLALERYARNPEARKELAPALPAPALPGRA
jgi:uncharacterized membrane protein YjgN (DUF898 family)